MLKFSQCAFGGPGNGQGIGAVLPYHHHDDAGLAHDSRGAERRLRRHPDGRDVGQIDIHAVFAAKYDFSQIGFVNGLSRHRQGNALIIVFYKSRPPYPGRLPGRLDNVINA